MFYFVAMPQIFNLVYALWDHGCCSGWKWFLIEILGIRLLYTKRYNLWTMEERQHQAVDKARGALFENIPQFTIQLFYTLMSGASVSLLNIASPTTSYLSLLFAIAMAPKGLPTNMLVFGGICALIAIFAINGSDIFWNKDSRPYWAMRIKEYKLGNF